MNLVRVIRLFVIHVVTLATHITQDEFSNIVKTCTRSVGNDEISHLVNCTNGNCIVIMKHQLIQANMQL